MDSDYLAVCRQLTRPTDDQCEAYAGHMAQRHSWHKHMPLHPRLPFAFLVGPRAELSSDWGGALMDRRYVAVRTPEAHLRAFGCLDCVAPYGGSNGLVEEVQRECLRTPRELWVLGHDDGHITVPPEIVEAGTALVNAMVDPRARRISPRFWLGDYYNAKPYLTALGHTWQTDEEFQVIFDRVVTPEHVAEVREATLAEMVAAIHRLRDLIWP